MKRSMEITVTDECLASWMTINNTAIAYRVSDWISEKHYWTGVVFRIGKYKLVPNKPKEASLFGVRMFYKSGSWIDIPADEFEDRKTWINVVPSMEPNVPGRTEPVDTSKKGDRDRFLPPQKSQAHFKMLPGGITVWEDWRAIGGFDLEARMAGNVGKHNRYAFTFWTEASLAQDGADATPRLSDYGFRVEVVKKNPDETETYPELRDGTLVREPIVAIMIAGTDDLPTHDDGQNPPQKP